jgi:predicted DNA-binding transcriptional regulator AlpA
MKTTRRRSATATRADLPADNPRSPSQPRLSQIVRPVDVSNAYGVCGVTRWRWEKTGRLPPRDAYLNGEAVGWKRETIEAVMAGKR